MPTNHASRVIDYTAEFAGSSAQLGHHREGLGRATDRAAEIKDRVCRCRAHVVLIGVTGVFKRITEVIRQCRF
jgi:hypothetical protein